MAKPNETKLGTPKQMIAALSEARDSARLRLHLLSLDARQRWQELEAQIDDWQASLESGTAEVGGNAVERVLALRQAVKDFWSTQQPSELVASAGPLIRQARTCFPNHPLSEAARLMWELDCGSVPVVDDSGNLVGMITDRDICMAAYTRDQPLSALSVKSTMSEQVASAAPGDTIEQIVRVMREHQVRRVPIVDQGKFVGIITLADVIHHLQGTNGFSGSVALAVAGTVAEISKPRQGHDTSRAGVEALAG